MSCVGLISCPHESQLSVSSFSITLGYSSSGTIPGYTYTDTATRTVTLTRVAVPSGLTTFSGFSAIYDGLSDGEFVMIADQCFPAYYAIIAKIPASTGTDGLRVYSGDDPPPDDDIEIDISVDHDGAAFLDWRLAFGPTAVGPVVTPYLRNGMTDPALDWRDGDVWADATVTIVNDVVGADGVNAEQLVTFDDGQYFFEFGSGQGALVFRGITWPLVPSSDPVITRRLDVTLGAPEGDDDAMALLPFIQITKHGNGFRFGFIGDLGEQVIELITYDSTTYDALRTSSGGSLTPAKFLANAEIIVSSSTFFSSLELHPAESDIITGNFTGTDTQTTGPTTYTWTVA